MLERIDQLKSEAETALASLKTAADVEAFRAKYLSPKGAFKALMDLLKQVPADQKRAFGQGANTLRAEIEKRFEEIRNSLGAAASVAKPTGPVIDVTEPGLPPRLGRSHVITQTIDDLVDVFGRMGFDVATGPEVEDEFHNFIALNIPESHPARDPLDNFYLQRERGPGAKGPRGQGADTNASASTSPSSSSPSLDPSTPRPLDPAPLAMLRSQTSTIQIRVMEKTKPPVRVVAMGRVYRPDEHDATHYSMFHQVEGLYVDRKVSMSDLKTTLLQFARAYFGEDAEVRLRPSFFPFTEPSAEMDVKMNVRGTVRWVEIGGCGMVDPNVFKAVGYDPEEWTGFAFGLGIERLAMRKYGITDIRWLFENDIRFLRQF